MADSLSSLINSPGLSSTPSSQTQANVAPYAQQYVGNMLAQGQALANAPMPAYTGQLTAGPSQLQQQAFSGLSNLTLPQGLTTAQENLANIAQASQNAQFNPLQFTNTYTAPGAYGYQPVTTQQFTPEAAQQLMNPYLKSSLQAQMDIMNQQEQAQEAQNQAKLAQSGAFGGARTAVMNAQTQLNNQLAQNQLVSQGYNTAYQNAMNQFNAQQQQGLAAQQANLQAGQYGYTQQMTQAQQQAQALQNQQQQQEAANQFQASLGLQGLQQGTTASQALANAANLQQQGGLQNLQALAAAGGTQQQLAQAANTAAYNQYLMQLQYPQTMLKLQSSLLGGLPISGQTTYGAMPSYLQQAAGTVGGVNSILQGLGYGSTGTSNQAAQSGISAIYNALTGKPSDTSGMTPIGMPPAEYSNAAYKDAAGNLYDLNGNTVAIANQNDGSLLPASYFGRGTNANYGDQSGGLPQPVYSGISTPTQPVDNGPQILPAPLPTWLTNNPAGYGTSGDQGQANNPLQLTQPDQQTGG